MPALAKPTIRPNSHQFRKLDSAAPRRPPKPRPPLTTLAAPISAFLESRRIDRGAADKTIEAYQRDLTAFANTLPPDKTLETIEREHLVTFLTKLAHAKQKATSISRTTSALRQFFKFCCLELNLKHNPAENLESPQLPQRLPKVLTIDQVTKLLEATDTGLPYSHATNPDALKARDRAMIYLLYATGLRVSELIGLTTHNIDLQNEYARVKGKGSKERIAPFATQAGDILREYLDSHRPTLPPQTDHLFPNHQGQPLTRQGFWKTLNGVALQAGLSVDISPHKLRHSFATHLLQSGMSLRSLQLLLGHADLTTTQIYTHISPEHLKTAHRKFHPRGE
ncbi:site-specific tyrosine recombinase XerD [Bdellovibrionota bacterium FG-2]